MRLRTWNRLFKTFYVVLISVFSFSFCLLIYLLFFERITLSLPSFLPFFIDPVFLAPVFPVFIFLLLVEYTPLGLILGDWLLIPINSTLMLTLRLLALTPLAMPFLLPLFDLTYFERVGCETLKEAVEEFKSRIWSTRDGKVTIISMIIGFTVLCVLGTLLFLSLSYMIDHGLYDIILILTVITIFTDTLFIFPRCQRMLNQKLQVKPDSVKPKN